MGPQRVLVRFYLRLFKLLGANVSASILAFAEVAAKAALEEFVKRNMPAPLWVSGAAFGALEGLLLAYGQRRVTVVDSVPVRMALHALWAVVPFWVGVPLHVAFNLLVGGAGGFRAIRDAHLERWRMLSLAEYIRESELSQTPQLPVSVHPEIGAEANGWAIRAGSITLPASDPLVQDILLQQQEREAKATKTVALFAGDHWLAQPGSGLGVALHMGLVRFAVDIPTPEKGYWASRLVPSFLRNECFDIMTLEETLEYIDSRPWTSAKKTLRSNELRLQTAMHAVEAAKRLTTKNDEKLKVAAWEGDQPVCKVRPLVPMRQVNAEAFRFEKPLKRMLAQTFEVRFGDVMAAVRYVGEPSPGLLDELAQLFEAYELVILIQGDDVIMVSGDLCACFDIRSCDRCCGPEYQAWVGRLLVDRCLDPVWIASYLEERQLVNEQPAEYHDHDVADCGLQVKTVDNRMKTDTGEILTAILAALQWINATDGVAQRTTRFTFQGVVQGFKEELTRAGVDFTMESSHGQEIMPRELGTFLAGAFWTGSLGIRWMPLSLIKSLHVPVPAYSGSLQQAMWKHCANLRRSEYGRYALIDGLMARLSVGLEGTRILEAQREILEWDAYEFHFEGEQPQLPFEEMVQFFVGQMDAVEASEQEIFELKAEMVMLLEELNTISQGSVEMDGAQVALQSSMRPLFALRFRSLPKVETKGGCLLTAGLGMNFFWNHLFPMTKTASQKARAKAKAKAKAHGGKPPHNKTGKRWHFGVNTPWGGLSMGSGDKPVVNLRTAKSVRSLATEQGQSQMTPFANRRERIATVKASETLNSQTVLLQPGLEDTFPWLAGFASKYQKYMMTNVSFEFIPTVGEFAEAGKQGRVVLCYNADCFDANINSLSEAENLQPRAVGVPTQRLVLRVPPENLGRQLLVRNGNIPAGATVQDFDFGRLYVVTAGGAAATDATAIGELYVNYDVVLINPFVGTLAVTPPTTHSSSITFPTASALTASWADLQGFTAPTTWTETLWNGLGIANVISTPSDVSVSVPAGRYFFSVTGYVQCTGGSFASVSLRIVSTVYTWSSFYYSRVASADASVIPFTMTGVMSLLEATELKVQGFASVTAGTVTITGNPRFFIQSV